jgi:fructose-bisphosphate aldolase class II
MLAAAKNASMPVAVHLDHGTTLECIGEALRLGFSSVMFDGSHLSFEENIEKSKELVSMAKPYGAAVEAEIGCVGGSEDCSVDIAMRCTSPDQAEIFAERTGVDALAIAIGNAHGFYKEAPQLRFDILESVRDRVSIPLVLHGGTGISEEDFIRCHQSGIKKINIATATFAAAERKVKEGYEKGEINGYYDMHVRQIQGAYENAKKHMEIFYSIGKAE